MYIIFKGENIFQRMSLGWRNHHQREQTDNQGERGEKMTRDGRTFPLDFVWRREVSQSPRGKGTKEKYQRSTKEEVPIERTKEIPWKKRESRRKVQTTPQGNQEVSQTQRHKTSL